MACRKSYFAFCCIQRHGKDTEWKRFVENPWTCWISELEIAKIKRRIDEEEILGNKQPIKRKGTRKIIREIWDWSDGGNFSEKIGDDSLIEPREIIGQVKKLMPEERYIRGTSFRKIDYFRLKDLTDKWRRHWTIWLK